MTIGSIWVVAAALTHGDGRILLQQRPVGKQHAGLWEFPGGKVEPGETPEQALVRELAEELTIQVDPAALEPLAFASAAPIVLLLYRCRRWAGTVVTSDGAAWRWCAPDMLDELPMPPADRHLLAALRR